jgi:hypothetical protein
VGLGGGTVYDVYSILAVIEAGRKALEIGSAEVRRE